MSNLLSAKIQGNGTKGADVLTTLASYAWS